MTKGNIIPGMRYRDAPAAIDWLCKAFGFERRLVVEGEGGTIRHAQLTLGNGMIMLGTAREDEFGKLLAVPNKGDRVTQSPYIVVQAIEAHYEKAKVAGAEIVTPIEDQEDRGLFYAARDPEGHLWCFGSYDPWVEPGSEAT